MANTIRGKILLLGQTVNIPTKNGSTFVKRELVLDASRYDEFTGEKRENYITFQFTQKCCDELNAFKVGDYVDVSFILSGRKYEKDGQTKYITDIVGYKVEKNGQHTASVTPSAPSEPTPQAPPVMQGGGDLPF